MSSLSSDILVSPQDMFSQVSNVATTAPYNTGSPQLGVRAVTGDGREFRYVQAGASNLIVGDLLQSPAQVVNFHKMATTAGALGGTSLTVTPGASTGSANQFASGWLLVETDSGGTPGYQYQVAGHPAISSATAFAVTLQDPILLAVSASATVSLIQNPYKLVIQNPVSATGTVVGSCIYPLTANYYGWVQTNGIATVLYESGVAATIGQNISASVNTAGAVEGAVTGQAAVGYMAETPTNTNFVAVKLNIS